MTLLPRALSLCRTLLSDYNETTTCIPNVSDRPCSSNTRTLWDILSSCALTLFACTWTAVHPNIPGIEEGIMAIYSRRLFLMVVAMIAPELMITWSVRQLFSAREAVKESNILGLRLRPASQANASYGGRKTEELENQPLHEKKHQAAEAISNGHNAAEENTTKLLPKSLQSHEGNSPDPSVSSAHNSDVWALVWSSMRRFFTWVCRFLPYQKIKPKEGENRLQGWALTHGYFAWMGGFLLYENDEPRATLTPKELNRLIRKKLVDIPIIVEEDIEDRSKGDALSKGIAILQLVWFIVQLAARYAQKLPISLLEIDTLAVTVLTCIAYGLWWKKPKDVGRPHIVHLKKTASQSIKLAYERENISRIPNIFYFSYLSYPFFSLSGIESVVSQSDVDSHRAPFLGGYTAEIRGGTVCLIGCISGMLFGGIHCLDWNVVFEGQMPWRVASLLILCAPVCTLIMYGMAHTEVGVPNALKRFIFVILIISVIVYVVARITLIVLMLMSLWSLPPGAYDTVAWTKFIPHYQ